MSNEYFLRQPKVLEMMTQHKAGFAVRDLLANVMNEARVAAEAEICSQVSHKLADYAERCRFLEDVVGMTLTQNKRVFVLKTFQKSLIPKYRLTFKTRDSIDQGKLLALVSEILTSSLDRDFKIRIETDGPQKVAKETIWCEDDTFACEADWFQIGFLEGNPVGFVFPVKYNGSDKDGLIEGTILNIGVLPEYRGSGYGTELLIKACEILDSVGMWRIFCDTDSENAPMIGAFRSAGFEEIDEIAKYRKLYTN